MKNPPSSDLRTRRHIGTHTKSSLPQSSLLYGRIEESGRRSWCCGILAGAGRSALDALQNSSKVQRNYIVYQIRKAYLDIIDKGNEVTLFWVPAHSGIPGNESADQDAKLAAIEGYKPDFRVPYEDLLVESRARADKQFQEYMEEVSRTKGTRYFEQFHTISKKTWFHESSLSREEIVLINRLRSNHINVNESLHRVNMTELSMRRPPSDNKSFNLPLQ
ncbi:PREDICTED: uncharacterized protein LOC108763880 [Trachymyrmex cornetzi]|uniref:uncharacterized protein LOC108763880 n=1 Tax=Trachymyrmex cornetzi TaxID=471704 RepID=UPI00084F5B5F|nr:PREDICTED: uncharacterized protein LOC108763880 [Trachymyrmex cornetzi]